MKIRKVINLNDIILLEKINMIYNQKYTGGKYLYEVNKLNLEKNKLNDNKIENSLLWLEQFKNQYNEALYYLKRYNL